MSLWMSYRDQLRVMPHQVLFSHTKSNLKVDNEMLTVGVVMSICGTGCGFSTSFNPLRPARLLMPPTMCWSDWLALAQTCPACCDGCSNRPVGYPTAPAGAWEIIGPHWRPDARPKQFLMRCKWHDFVMRGDGWWMLMIHDTQQQSWGVMDDGWD